MNAQALAPIESSTDIAPFANDTAFNTAQRVGKALASSSLVPETYRGNLANVLIAMEVANRIGASPLAVMQSLYIVHGRPSWSASFLIATVNACGRFTPLRFETIGDDPAKDDYRVRAVAKDKDSEEICEGPWITWAMVKSEGWHSKNGSKWKSMPALMFMYRAAAFWTRVYAPELSLGIHTAEEVQDMTLPAPVRSADVGSLEAALVARAQGAAEEPEAPIEGRAEPTFTAQGIHDALADCKTLEALDEVASVIDQVPEAERAALTEFWRECRVALTTD